MHGVRRDPDSAAAHAGPTPIAAPRRKKKGRRIRTSLLCAPAFFDAAGVAFHGSRPLSAQGSDCMKIATFVRVAAFVASLSGLAGHVAFVSADEKFQDENPVMGDRNVGQGSNRIDIPNNWNHELVMLLHGYEPKGSPRGGAVLPRRRRPLRFHAATNRQRIHVIGTMGRQRQTSRLVIQPQAEDAGGFGLDSWRTLSAGSPSASSTADPASGRTGSTLPDYRRA